MYNLSNDLKLSISEFDDANYSYTNVTIIQGISGVLPVMFVDCATSNDTVDANEVIIKFMKGDRLLINCKSFIYERKMINTSTLQLSIYLMPKDFIYGKGSLSFDSLEEIVNSLWSGEIENIPIGDEMVANQMNEYNNKFLTNCLLCIKSDFNFTYEASIGNLLRGIDMSSTNVIVECKDLIGYSIEDKNSRVKFNPLESILIDSTTLGAAGVITSDPVRFTESSAINYYMNYSTNKALLNRHNESITLTYQDYSAIRIGDIVEVAVSPSHSKKYRVEFIQFDHFNHQSLTKANLTLINE